MEALEINKLSFTYAGAEREALLNVTLSLRQGSFNLLCGRTGCGKSTLLRLIKNSIAPNGRRSGSITLFGKDAMEYSQKDEVPTVGIVMQRPENQIVADTVLGELVFGLESIGMSKYEMRRRAAETAVYFGIDSYIHKKVSELSGGQKQILALASVMATRPKLLLLDEPLAQLDPIAAADFLAAVMRLNRDTGITVLASEHKLSSAFSECDNVFYMEEGSITAEGAPSSVVSSLAQKDELFLPAAARLFRVLNGIGQCPLSVRDGRDYLNKKCENKTKKLPTVEKTTNGEIVLQAKNVYFRYEKNSPDVIRGADLSLSRGEILCLIGGNATGKTTFLKCCAGLLKPYDGNVYVNGKKLSSYTERELYNGITAYLPQDVNAVFSRMTVEAELALSGVDISSVDAEIATHLKSHPYDLSGGEQQRVALLKLLAGNPQVILLDEPTRGLDPFRTKKLIEELCKLKSEGKAILAVTHDMEFAAEVADSISVFFAGDISKPVPAHEFLGGSSFFTTEAGRITSGFYENAVTVAEAAELCILNGGKHED